MDNCSELADYIKKNFPGLHVVDGTIYPECITPGVLKEIKDLEVRTDDVWIATYPKSGTKWCVDIVTNVLRGGDAKDTMAKLPTLGFPVEMNFPVHFPPEDSAAASLNHRVITSWESPRVLTTHLSVERLPKQIFTKKPKVVYVMRNPKDVAVSGYQYNKNFLGPFKDQLGIRFYYTDWDSVFQAYMEGTDPGGPWWDHVLGFWKHRGDQNFLILTFENMKQDPSSAVRQIADFLGVTLSDDRVSQVVEATSFVNMKKQASNTLLAGHFRRGEVGDWRNYFTVAQNEAFDEKITQLFQNTSIKFQF